MKKKDNIKRGFTLVELLATIVIISIAFGIGYSIVGNIISNTEDKTSLISQASIKESANLYSKENIDSITWKKLETEENYYACVKVSELINTGYLKEKQANDYLNKDVYLVKNPDNVILKETIDTEGNLCSGDSPGNRVKVPTAEKICNDIEYNGSPQELAKIPPERIDEIDLVDNRNETNAGVYKVEVKLKNSNDVWDRKNNTKDTITINCRIKKATPQVEIKHNITNSTNVGDKKYAIVFSNIDGNFEIKVSNNSYISAKLIELQDVIDYENISLSDNLEARKGIEAKILSSRNMDTDITVTLTPKEEDKKNYKTAEKSFTISKSGKIMVEVPTAQKYCKEDLAYDGKEQVLVNMPKESDGFVFKDYIAKEQGRHVIKAVLKYGYAWSNGEDVANTTKEYSIICNLFPRAEITCADKDYNGEVQTIASCLGGTPSNHKKTNAGEYTISCAGDEEHARAIEKKCKINKVPATITCSNKTYNGSNQTIASCSGGTASGNSKKDAGNYTVSCTGDKNHTNATSKNCSIAKATATITCADKMYNGSNQTIASCSGGTASGNSKKDAGNYKVSCTGDSNHNNATDKICKIIAADITITFSPNGGTFTSPKRVEVSCSATSGVKSFSAKDDKNDNGTKSNNKISITLSSTGNRSITATCTSNGGGKKTATKSFTINAANTGGGGGGGGNTGGGNTGGGNTGGGNTGGGKKTGGCFLAGTKIMTMSGLQNIEEIKVGEYVLTYNHISNNNEYQKVTNVFMMKDIDEELYTLTIDGKFISATGHHRFYIKNGDNYSYIPAENLKIGDIVMYADGSYHKITDIIHSPIHKTVYNLEVENNHNFYVGDGVLVHNASRPIIGLNYLVINAIMKE